MDMLKSVVNKDYLTFKKSFDVVAKRMVAQKYDSDIKPNAFKFNSQKDK
ncbi:hypothetical protein [uncultured Arcobacter sp.]|nr:hypothetical protein [uncultured Arcobacter sp.]